jgi:DNA adenine methylase
VTASKTQFRFPAIAEDKVARPFLKWAGGKTRLLSVLRRCRPAHFGTYFEPFLGGAALFFDTDPAHAVLGDSNADLVACYEVVRDSPLELLDALDELIVSESEYYRIRALAPKVLSKVDSAARFIYLSKICHAG